MAKSPDNKYGYVPPSVQKSIAQQMDRSMPAHLKNYQQGHGALPTRVEREMAQNLQKTLPAHMKQYIEPYLHQNVVNSAKPQTQNQPGVLSSYVKPSRPKNSNRQNLIFLPKAKRQVMSSMDEFEPVAAAAGSNSGRIEGDYDFILNPEKSAKIPMFNFGGESPLKRIIIFGTVVVVIIILFFVGLSFLNQSSNAYREKLLEIAQTQIEIARISSAAQEKISSRDLLNKAVNVQYSVNSSNKEVVSAIAERGGKADDKKLELGQNPENDAALVEGEENGKFDETYDALLKQQLENYQLQLESAYLSANNEEKAIIESAFEQIDLLLGNVSEELPGS